MNLPVFITARLASKRLPRKHLLPLGGLTVIEHVVQRCFHFGFEPYLCIPNDEPEWGMTERYITFAGNPDHVETRIMECATTFDIKSFHQLDGDDPFFDPDAVIDSYNCLFPKLAKILPSANSQSGSGRVGTSYNLNAGAAGERFLKDLGATPWPQRLTLDYEEDYHLLLALERMGCNYMAPRWFVDECFTRNPDLHKINWFRTPEWKERQINET